MPHCRCSKQAAFEGGPLRCSREREPAGEVPDFLSLQRGAVDFADVQGVAGLRAGVEVELGLAADPVPGAGSAGGPAALEGEGGVAGGHVPQGLEDDVFLIEAALSGVAKHGGFFGDDFKGDVDHVVHVLHRSFSLRCAGSR